MFIKKGMEILLLSNKQLNVSVTLSTKHHSFKSYTVNNRLGQLWSRKNNNCLCLLLRNLHTLISLIVTNLVWTQHPAGVEVLHLLPYFTSAWPLWGRGHRSVAWQEAAAPRGMQVQDAVNILQSQCTLLDDLIYCALSTSNSLANLVIFTNLY